MTAITQKRDQAIVNAWNAGARIQDLVSEFDIGQHTIRKIIWLAPDAAPRKRGPKVGSLKPRTREIEERCRAGGEAFADIAQAFGVSVQRIGQIANRAGLGRRHSRVTSATIVAKRTKEREKRAQAKAKRQAAKAARKDARQKLMDKARILREKGKSWSEVQNITGISGSLFIRYHPEAREREFVPRRRQQP